MNIKNIENYIVLKFFENNVDEKLKGKKMHWKVKWTLIIIFNMNDNTFLYKFKNWPFNNGHNLTNGKKEGKSQVHDFNWFFSIKNELLDLSNLINYK